MRPRQLDLFLRIHPRGGLIQQKHLGIRCQSPRDLEAPLISVREVLCLLRFPVQQLEDLEQAARSLGDRPLLSDVPRRAKDRTGHGARSAKVAGDTNVVQHRKIGEQPDVLECAGQPRRGPLVRLETDERLPIKLNRTGIRCIHAREQVEHRRLAGAVGADQAVQGALWKREREVLHRLQTAE
jgi:hypothetical protein